MDIKEFAFKQGDTAITRGPDTIVLECKDCGNMDVQLKVDPFSGHMFEQAVTYTCTVCRGNMNLLTEDDEEENDDE
jgi:hypothetical protein